MKSRHDAGEPLYRIGQDFDRRGERTANNKPWVVQKGAKRTNYSRFYRVYHLYKRLQAEGKALGRTNPIDEAALASSSASVRPPKTAP